MVNVAVMGGTGRVGRTVVEVLREHPEHSVVVLGRKASGTIDSGVAFEETDYASAEDVRVILERHQVDTVICCLLIENDTVAKAQANVIDAAEASRVTKRFVASNWSSPSDETNPWAHFQLDAQAQLRKTSLVWTEIATGYMLDFWGQPFLRTHLGPSLIAIDIKYRAAGIPGTGTEPVSFAYSFDLARFIAERLLFLPDGEWEPTTLLVGDVVTWNEFLALAEGVRGEKFEVRYDSLETLIANEMTELPNHVESYPFFPKPALRGLYTALGILMAKGHFHHPIEESLNGRRFPEFKMLTVKEMLEQTWGANRGVIP